MNSLLSKYKDWLRRILSSEMRQPCSQLEKYPEYVGRISLEMSVNF